MAEQLPSKRLEELIRERARLDAELERHQRLFTILFMDIVGSTRFYDQHGDVAGLVMVQKVLDTLTPLVEQHDGVVVKTIGDAILARFNNAQIAVRCAMAMQRAMASRNVNRAPNDQIHIRVALNLGLGLLKEDGDVFGDVVNVASRIEKATDPDEIAISPSVYEQIQHVPDIAVRKKASGVELRGKAEKLDLYAVIWREGERSGPAPPRPSSEQLALATGLHTGLAELARPSTPRPAPAEPPRPPPSRPSARGTATLGKEKAEKPAAVGVRFLLAQVRADGSLGERYPLDRPGMIAGRQQGDIRLPNDPLVAPQHARFTQLGDAVYVEDLGSPQGVFVRLREPHPLKEGDVILLGRQKFRLAAPPAGAPPAETASPKGTRILGAGRTTGAAAAPVPPQLIRLDAENQEGDRYPLKDAETLLGRSQGTYTFPDDHYMSGSHARITLEDGQFVLEDRNSTNGTFIRIRKRLLVRDGDTVLIGAQLLRVVTEGAQSAASG